MRFLKQVQIHAEIGPPFLVPYSCLKYSVVVPPLITEDS